MKLRCPHEACSKVVDSAGQLTNKCPACIQIFCGYHRAPEAHACKFTDKWFQEKKQSHTESLLRNKTMDTRRLS